MILHKSKDDFEGIILQVSEQHGIRADILEKDYYVTLLLEELSKKQEECKMYFKGGTALYKALSSINRFSEDIDLTVRIDDLTTDNQQKKRLEEAAEGYTSLTVLKEDLQYSKSKNSITAIYGYNSIFDDDHGLDPLQRFGRVKVEATSFTISEPVEPMLIAPVIYLYATKEAQQILNDQFEVRPFEVQTIKLERIFVDKMFAAEFYYRRHKESDSLNPTNYAFDVAKHIYDLMVLFEKDQIQRLLSDPDELSYLIGLKRVEEQIRKGGISPDLLIKDFTWLKELLGDVTFYAEYVRMQDIYVFKEEHKAPLEKVSAVIQAIQSILE